jgi:hypothetical protein
MVIMIIMRNMDNNQFEKKKKIQIIIFIKKLVQITEIGTNVTILGKKNMALTSKEQVQGFKKLLVLLLFLPDSAIDMCLQKPLCIVQLLVPMV